MEGLQLISVLFSFHVSLILQHFSCERFLNE